MASQYKLQKLAWLRERSYKADAVLDIGGGDKKANELTTVECNSYKVLDIDPATKPNFIHDINEFTHKDQIFAVERNPSFDLIFCLDVFEYVYQPYNAVANIYNWLSVGGKAVINFPFLYPMHNPEGIDYLRYTPEWVNKMLIEKFKFSEVNIWKVYATTGVNQLMSFWIAEGMHYRKQDIESAKIIGCIVEVVK